MHVSAANELPGRWWAAERDGCVPLVHDLRGGGVSATDCCAYAVIASTRGTFGSKLHTRAVYEMRCRAYQSHSQPRSMFGVPVKSRIAGLGCMRARASGGTRGVGTAPACAPAQHEVRRRPAGREGPGRLPSCRNQLEDERSRCERRAGPSQPSVEAPCGRAAAAVVPTHQPTHPHTLKKTPGPTPLCASEAPSTGGFHTGVHQTVSRCSVPRV